MKSLKTLPALLLALCMLLSFSSCSRKKKVTVIQNTNQPPETQKSVDGATTANPASVNASEAVVAELDATNLTVHAANMSFTIPYKKIAELSYMTDWDYSADSIAEGSQTERTVTAQMSTSDNEKYFLFIYKDVKAYVIVAFGGTEYVFNAENAEATKRIYDKIKEKIK